MWAVHRSYIYNYHSLCASCSGTLSKYVAIDGYNNHADAAGVCADTFGTTLASIHSDDDMAEAIMACKEVTIHSGCWIGLELDENARFLWLDATNWDYGRIRGEYPWPEAVLVTGEQRQCIQIDPDSDYLWTESDCDGTLGRTLCNAPSEVCNVSPWFRGFSLHCSMKNSG